MPLAAQPLAISIIALKASLAQVERRDVLAPSLRNRQRLGWVVGGGVEQMLSPHWTFSAKFHYIDLGRTTVSCSSATDFENCVSIGYRGDLTGNP